MSKYPSAHGRAGHRAARGWAFALKNRRFQITRNGPSTSGDAIVDPLAHYYKIARKSQRWELQDSVRGVKNTPHNHGVC